MIRILQESQPGDLTMFQIGDIITHKRYEYRGVIVYTDLHFQGDDHWCLLNTTQLNKDQPWYFVLVDGNQQVTYVTEENLNLDSSDITIVHPMLNLFFSGFNSELNQYIRNDVPWNPGKPPDALPPPNFQPPCPPSF